MVDIIAEVGSVHDGSFGNAMALIDLATEVGATAVKFQTHVAEAETIQNAPNPPYFDGEPRFDYFKRTAFSSKQWHLLRKRAKDQNILFGSSPFAVEAVDLLEEIEVDFLKIASGEVTNLLLLERCARSEIPVILSSGMSDWEELDVAVSVLKQSKAPLTVMQCSSAYPCPENKVGLNVISEMKDRWRLPVGFSDHTEGVGAGLAAIAYGAVAIEKHLTFSRSMYGSDASLAAEPGLFATFVKEAISVSEMIRNPINKDDLSGFSVMKSTFEKSFVANQPLKTGTILDRNMLSLKKPGTGIPAKELPNLVGAQLCRDVDIDHIISWEDVLIDT